MSERVFSCIWSQNYQWDWKRGLIKKRNDPQCLWMTVDEISSLTYQAGPMLHKSGIATFPVTRRGEHLKKIWLLSSGRGKSKGSAKTRDILAQFMLITWRVAYIEQAESLRILVFRHDFCNSVPLSNVHPSDGSWPWATFGRARTTLPYMALHICVTIAG